MNRHMSVNVASGKGMNTSVYIPDRGTGFSTGFRWTHLLTEDCSCHILRV